jgi:hypothetical protein
MKFIFDSGASNVTISLTEALFMLKNNYLTGENIIGTDKYSIANGEIMEGTRIILYSIIIGGIELRNVEASIVHTPNAPLLLGQSALRKLGNFNFDYSNNTLTVFGGNTISSNINNSGTCITGNCINGLGTFIYSDGDKYIGEFKDGEQHALGTYTWLNGEKYVGQFLNDKKNGQGTYTWPDGSKYVGQFLNDEESGQGTHTWPNGSKYVGQWLNGKQNGQGTHTFPEGDKFVGEYKDGKRHGQGTYIWPDGEKYVGQWLNGKQISPR